MFLDKQQIIGRLEYRDSISILTNQSPSEVAKQIQYSWHVNIYVSCQLLNGKFGMLRSNLVHDPHAESWHLLWQPLSTFWHRPLSIIIHKILQLLLSLEQTTGAGEKWKLVDRFFHYQFSTTTEIYTIKIYSCSRRTTEIYRLNTSWLWNIVNLSY